jgi:hypothetical protein
MSVESTWPTAYQASDAARSLRRSKPPTQIARKGAPTHMTTAAAATSWPATETETSSECEMSLSVPTTTITPQPITKLPNRSAQRTCVRRRAVGAAAVGGIEAGGAPGTAALNAAP